MHACHDIEPHLSLLVDGQLPADAQADVRAHVSGCTRCRGLVADLEALRASARALGPIAPPQHIWLEVAGQVRLDGGRTVRPSVHGSSSTAARQWIGLAAALVIVTVGLYLIRDVQPNVSPEGSNAASTESVETVADQVNLAVVPAERVIADLEEMTNRNHDAIDPAVHTVLQDNLSRIDVTIAESRTALSSNPDSESARDSLFEALRRKISVLQTMVSLINEMRLGDQEGAARAAESLGKKS